MAITLEVDSNGDINVKDNGEYRLFVEYENLQALIDDLKNAKPIAKMTAKSKILEQVAIEKAKIADIQLVINGLQAQANIL